jgi:hypothetical protein
MAAQVGKVLQLVHSDRITVQVIPFKAGAYAAADSYFVLLEFEDESNLWPVVYIEGLTDNQYLQRGSDIARYRETVEYLRGRALILMARSSSWRMCGKSMNAGISFRALLLI